MSKRFGAAVAFLIITGAFLIRFWPDYQSRRAAEQNNRTIAIALDYEDIQAASVAHSVSIEKLLAQIKEIPVAVLALSEEAPRSDEKQVRKAGFGILWQIKTTDFTRLRTVLERVAPGDGCLSTEKHAAGYPMYLNNVAEVFRKNGGYLPVFEFLPQAGLPALAKKMDGRLIKAHLIGDRESFVPLPVLWKKRLMRAAHERGVRLFYLRLPPSRSWEQNTAFLDDISVTLSAGGYIVSKPQVYPHWEFHGDPARRAKLALLMAAAAPMMGLWLFGFTKKHPYGRFVLFCALSIWTGVAVYVTGSSPALVLGINQLSGVKAQLVLPLLFGAFLLFFRRGWKKWLNVTIKVKHVLFVWSVLGGLLVLYLMRSGNFPLIPVSNSERHFRDILENLLGARPRFKEFFIGHPALIAGFTLQKWGREARGWILLGLVGQISILNTFLHFHEPLQSSLLRSVHGLWMGSLLAIPLCWFLRRQVAEEKE